MNPNVEYPVKKYPQLDMRKIIPGRKKMTTKEIQKEADKIEAIEVGNPAEAWDLARDIGYKEGKLAMLKEVLKEVIKFNDRNSDYYNMKEYLEAKIKELEK